MAWNPPPQQQGQRPPPAADPFGAWPATTSAPQWPSSASSAAPQWPSSAAPAAASSAWPSTSAAPSAAPQWPSSTAGSANSAAWPPVTSSAPPASASAWPNTSVSAVNTSTGGWPDVSSASWASSSYTSPAHATSTTSAWPQAPTQPPATSSAAWPSTTSTAWPSQPAHSQSAAWGAQSAPAADPWSTSFQSTANNNGSFQSSFVSQAPQGAYDPFNTGNASRLLNASYQSTGTSFNNPFDVTIDDAGFFASAPATSKPKASSSLNTSTSKAPPVDDIPPPSEKTQRLMRVASMLFERGSLIKADKMLIQELVLRGNKNAEHALEVAERDGVVEDVHRVILKERSGKGDGDEDERAEHAASSFKKRPSVARKNSDDDDEQTETLDFKRSGSMKIEAPHPIAGGYSGTIPPEMSVQKGQFVGNILMRISSKKMFRKWKSVFFALDLPRLVIYEHRREWEMGMPAKFVLPLHECMWIAKPTLKKTYSLIDDGRRVYYSTLKENSPSVVASAAMAGMERPITFSPALEARVVAKFGSYYPDEISSFAHAVYSCVLHHQREAKAQRGNTSRGGKYS